MFINREVKRQTSGGFPIKKMKSLIIDWQSTIST